jgi:hypothetical protein
MQKTCSFVAVLAALVCAQSINAATLSQDFSTNPLQAGWETFGNQSLFSWDGTNQNLEVTWDSTQPNSYFYHRLGATLSRNDDFRFDFDLLLKDIVSGNEPGKTSGLEIGIGLFNLGTARGPDFMRGVFGGAPGIVEFDYFPSGIYDDGQSQFEIAATTTPTLISTNSGNYAPTIFAPFVVDLPSNMVVHVSLAYTSSNQTCVMTATTNGVSVAGFPDIVLNDPNTSGFGGTDDFRVDAFSINSYSSAGDDFDSVLGHGVVDNVVVTYSMPAEQFTGTPGINGWQGHFLSRSNWDYALERSTNLTAWTSVSGLLPGTGASISVQDTNPPSGQAYYRIRSSRPN